MNNPQPLSEEEINTWILETAREHSLYLTITTKTEVIRQLTEELKRERSARTAIQNAGAILYANTEGLSMHGLVGGRTESARSFFKAECERNR